MMRRCNCLGTTPLPSLETTQGFAENAETLKNALSPKCDQALPEVICPNPNPDPDPCCCCCPELLKFKFECCNVWIINDNAKCTS